VSARYPIEPVAALLGVELGVVGGHVADGPTSGLTALALLLEPVGGLSQSTLKRRRGAGGFDEWEADRVAIYLGVHPMDLWGAAWWRDALAAPVVDVVPFTPRGLRAAVAGGRVAFGLGVAA
jgi:hypothetical protein